VVVRFGAVLFSIWENGEVRGLSRGWEEMIVGECQLVVVF